MQYEGNNSLLADINEEVQSSSAEEGDFPNTYHKTKLLNAGLRMFVEVR